MLDHSESADAGSAAGGRSLVPTAVPGRHWRSRERGRLRSRYAGRWQLQQSHRL